MIAEEGKIITAHKAEATCSPGGETHGPYRDLTDVPAVFVIRRDHGVIFGPDRSGHKVALSDVGIL